MLCSSNFTIPGISQKFIVIISVSILFLLCACKSKETLFTNLSPESTGIQFQNNLIKKEGFNLLYYIYYYNGGGVSIGDINNDGLPDIFFTANSRGNNKLYLNKGNLQFEDITEKSGMQGISDWCTGTTMADVNGDGFLDIYVSSVSGQHDLTGHNELYINNQNNTFTEKSAEYGLNTSCFTTQTVFFDYDRDGDLDCYILNQSHHPHANIVDTSKRQTYDPLSGDRLYRNDMNGPAGKFVDVSRDAGIYQSSLGYGLGLAVADFNNDGWDDIYVGNDFHENDYYYVNQKNGTFKEEGAKHFGHYSRFSMGNDVADFNNDGQLDIVTADMLPPTEALLKTYGSDENPDIYRTKLTLNGYQNQYSRNALQINNGNGISFSEAGLLADISATDWSWSPLFADFNNDGLKDLFISSGIVKRPVDLDFIKFVSNLKARGADVNGSSDDDAINAMPGGASHPFFFEGSGTVSMKDVSEKWGTSEMKGYYNGAAYADLDNDGDLDVVINALNSKAVVLKNNSAQKNYLTISFRADSLNTFGLGTKVYLFDSGVIQYQQLMLTRGFQSSSDTRLHFGLKNSMIDSLLVVWPDQHYQLIKNVSANKQITLEKKNALDSFDFNHFFIKKADLLSEISDSIKLNWQHRENNFLDYNVQYLIPHEQSTRGPKMAIGDVNKDGLQDVFLCGAKNSPGTLMIQQVGGGFKISDSALFNRFSLSEDVDASFFDANGDGAVDLWVVSGGNEPPPGGSAYADRLFVNDGKGNFVYAENNLPPIFKNKSCIAVADIDKDGDQDVFTGTLSNPISYGIPQSSDLLINDGSGKFNLAGQSTIDLQNVGMVTSAIFADINNDNWPDLIVAGEWMPVKIYINEKGRFKETDIKSSIGLWQTLFVTDVNGDGYADIVAGNWGQNSKLWSGKDGSLKLYVKDFDSNGTIDQLMCYVIDGKEYTFLAKDELERPLPVLRKAYLTYREVAGKDVQFLFYDLFKNYQTLEVQTLASTCFMNDGQGNFTGIELPKELQLAPLMTFANFGSYYVAAGNFYGVVPYEGRYDAMFPTVFSFNRIKNEFEIKYVYAGLRTEARDTKWIHSDRYGDLLIIAGNNGPLHFFKTSNDVR